jgi:hypothetical protein
METFSNRTIACNGNCNRRQAEFYNQMERALCNIRIELFWNGKESISKAIAGRRIRQRYFLLFA